MEKIFEQGLLYDFYGELLTEHQRRIYEDAVYNDLSLGEIAQQEGISRQGVHDLIKRCDKILSDYEASLHLVERFSEARKMINDMLQVADRIAQKDAEGSLSEELQEIKQLGTQLLDKL
ncbi:MAG: YlxM family DNA-binding protein [Lachnospiraceae bacterium]